MLTKYEDRKKFNHIFQLFSSGLIFIDEQGTILDMNSHASIIIGIEKDKIIGTQISPLFGLMNQTIEERDIMIDALYREGHLDRHFEIETFAGEAKFVHVVVSVQEDTGLFLLELNDESEKVYMKKRLDQSEALSTLGQLAAGIAHEIRNPMTSLKGFTQLLNQNATEDTKRYLTVIKNEIDKMEDILTQFLELSRPSKSKFTSMNIEDTLIEVVNFMAPEALLKSININVSSYINKSCHVVGDCQLLKQVFINAIKNGIEAMPNGGNIYINITYKSEKMVSITVKDQGHGIDEITINKIFQPFFTTKTTGTGLGLSHVYKVIEEHGGNIEVQSKVGEGTTFEILLPCRKEL